MCTNIVETLCWAERELDGLSCEMDATHDGAHQARAERWHDAPGTITHDVGIARLHARIDRLEAAGV